MKNQYIIPNIDVTEIKADCYICVPSVKDKTADDSEQLVRKRDFGTTDFCSGTDQDFNDW